MDLPSNQEDKQGYIIVSPVKAIPTSVQKKSVCAVAICTPPYPPGTKFHTFPKNKDLSKQWEVACKRQDKFKPEKAHICSQHFSPEAYERDVKFEEKHKRLRLVLKKDAVPTRKLLPGQASGPMSARGKRQHKKKLASTTHDDEEVLHEMPHLSDNEDEAPLPTSTPEMHIKRLEDLVEDKDKEIKELKMKVRMLQQTIRRKDRAKAKAKQSKPVLGPKKKLQVAKEVVKAKFNWTEQQLDLLSKKTKTHWTSEDIVMGLTMRGVSRRLYQYLRQKKLLPLPSLASLREHIQGFKCLPGIQKDILQGEMDI